MKKQLLSVFCSLFLVLLAVHSKAQATTTTLEKAKTDANPLYEQFNSQCILDKVEYQKDRTIFHFRYRASTYTSIWLYSPEGDHPWFLKDKANNKEYNLIGVYNVRKNNRLKHKEVTGNYVYLSADQKKEKTYFECEVHFERLPENVSEVDLIEGRGMEKAWNHFHCFNIKVSPLKEKKIEKPVVAPIAIEDVIIPIPVHTIQETVAPVQTVATNKTNTNEADKPAKENNTTLVDVATTLDWSVFPTPATSMLNVQQSTAQEAQLELVNINGQVIWTGRMQGTTTIDISDLTTGTYFLQHTTNGNTTAQKVLVK